MKKKHTALRAAAALLLLLTSASCALSGEEPAGTSGTTTQTALPEPTEAPAQTSAPQTEAQTSAQTAPETTAEETEEETTAEETTAEQTTEEVTTASPIDLSVPARALYAPVHVAGAVCTGKTAAGYDIEVLDGNTYVGGILIANKTYALASTYIPSLYARTDWTVELLPEAQNAFLAMQADFAQENPGEKGFKVQSGYRSYTYQGGLYDKYVKNNGKAAADTFSARPGHSEHQTGLAADINVKGTSTLYESIKDTAEGKWLAANAHRYGFILRYPAGKDDVTGYKFEPWHFRYIGKEAAAAVYESGLTLEEFLGIDSVYAD